MSDSDWRQALRDAIGSRDERIRELGLLCTELRSAPTMSEMLAQKLEYERNLGEARAEVGRLRRELKRYREFGDDVDELRRVRDVCINHVESRNRQRLLREEAERWDARWRQRVLETRR